MIDTIHALNRRKALSFNAFPFLLNAVPQAKAVPTAKQAPITPINPR